MSDHDQENDVVIDLVQAMVGLVSSNFRSVSVDVSEGGPKFQFLLYEDSIDDREAISDIEFEFEALQDSPSNVAVEVLVTTQPIHEILRLRRIVFARREE